MRLTAIGENATGWGDSYPRGMNDRFIEDLVGASKGGHLYVPDFRPFDFLAGPNQPLPYLRASTNQVCVEAVRGRQPVFHRNADFDEVFFQWAGTTTYETEFGTFAVEPAELLLIPTGVAHRATGSADSLRMSMRVRDPLDVTIDEMHGRTRYDVVWNGDPHWLSPAAAPEGDTVYEAVHTWEDAPGEETLIARNLGRLIGSSTKGRPVKAIRLFDIFTYLTGAGNPPPCVMRNDSFMLECFNSIGPQKTFHRGNRADETQLQFAGIADNVSEFGSTVMAAGDQCLVRRGIAHRVIGSPRYRRMVFYSAERWELLIDPAKPLRTTTFDVTETVVETAPWRKELEAALA